MANSQNPEKGKQGYPSLSLALKAKSGIARSKGARFKRLRIYQHDGRWFLTKMSTDSFRNLKRKFKKHGVNLDDHE